MMEGKGIFQAFIITHKGKVCDGSVDLPGEYQVETVDDDYNPIQVACNEMENLVSAWDHEGVAQNACGFRINSNKFQSLGLDEENEIWNLSGNVKNEHGQTVSGGCTIAKTLAVFLVAVWREKDDMKYNSECMAKVEELQKILIDGGS